MKALIAALILAFAPAAFGLTASPNALTFNMVQGGPTPAPKSITVTGGSWTEDDREIWFHASPPTGKSDSQVTVSIEPRPGPVPSSPGTYNSSLTLSAGLEVITVPVKLVIAPSGNPTPSPAAPSAAPTVTPGPSPGSASVTLSWDANTESDIVDYTLNRGTASHTYTTKTHVGNVTTAVSTGLTPGLNYFFAASAINSSGAEGPYSNEVSYRAPTPTPTPPPPSPTPNPSATPGPQPSASPSPTASPRPTPRPVQNLRLPGNKPSSAHRHRKKS